MVKVTVPAVMSAAVGVYIGSSTVVLENPMVVAPEPLFALHEIEPVEHRLQMIKAGGKIIIDDSFNGNLEGMLEAVKISSTYTGRKVIITPGIVESTVEANTTLACAIDEVFDVVILTGSLNTNVLSEHIDSTKIVTLKDKKAMEECLAKTTKVGDLILFANDAPNFI